MENRAKNKVSQLSFKAVCDTLFFYDIIGQAVLRNYIVVQKRV
ncbi:hypothetical protein ACJDUH_05565 [Clostridium sp. WILCCON 0202]|uniref:Uncharacterized protein n=1 Tax=Candidatus Clostridium radicumherbarum TaxID=3381662 RepID=A0ABW8TSP9_9CLOT